MDLASCKALVNLSHPQPPEKYCVCVRREGAISCGQGSAGQSWICVVLVCGNYGWCRTGTHVRRQRGTTAIGSEISMAVFD
ncbi:hypothetical protein AnigIFM63604_009540 [Aspergillus niger]|uniref:Uncharacterized protein n=2 Tax=Aspergillus niger TaxID=5061 RepID=A2QV16_ASPNC|nr:uncharacterized protein BO96DRAFT_487796 [Aspergillus niger CBS 101883]XP_059601501.1 hypothetical protein An10g00640 [Aspergillus niger]PYH51471.1 hypothetical protein BO96DRAFT_487796 [Aspergillus niger CBS 101883]CAK40503.1 hypothetical protein An10g00640 [Aspergillus niger]GJP89869.1 uncharacterized protein AlacWU_02768 [Aspergillus niger]GKZ94201.1 hypothetical protein AnigIFM59636_007566 [Aspergillus niger]GLA52668.1 hypothetical protein AnigIFM63604_009540 [Aspergillus niger]